MDHGLVLYTIVVVCNFVAGFLLCYFAIALPQHKDARSLRTQIASFVRQVERPSQEIDAASERGASVPEIAFVLIMDIVGFSELSMKAQPLRVMELNQIVNSLKCIQDARQLGSLLTLPTGDGMAIAWFTSNPLLPVECSVDLKDTLVNYPQLKVRMGLHMGPVARVDDINVHRNVAGGGINMAQRVMDCAGAGELVLSHGVYELLAYWPEWKDKLTDLGEHSVKHGVIIRVYRLE